MANPSPRTYDLVLWGATSFVGQLVAEYLLKARSSGLRWALAGRSADKLEQVRARLAAQWPEAAALPLVVAEATDAASLAAFVAQTRLVVTTVGPYALYGASLVAACAKHGTDYCDLTGEPQFIRAMIDAHHAEAERTGARIVHCCGFDSIPSDLGVFMLEHAARERHGVPCARVHGVFGPMRGGISGGTLASVMTLMEQASKDASVRELLRDPYALAPGTPERGPDRRDTFQVRWDAQAGSWIAPFPMAAINTRMVRRTNALLGYAYGRDFSYQESLRTGAGFKGRALAYANAVGLGAFAAAAFTAPGRGALKRVLPKPGEGPSAAAREAGFFTLQLHGTGTDAQGQPFTLQGTVRGTSDPGYGETAKMLSESALGLLETQGRFGGGVLTPAVALGDLLMKRLRHAGMTFSVAA